jgi:hypothetical protein
MPYGGGIPNIMGPSPQTRGQGPVILIMPSIKIDEFYFIFKFTMIPTRYQHGHF